MTEAAFPQVISMLAQPDPIRLIGQQHRPCVRRGPVHRS